MGNLNIIFQFFDDFGTITKFVQNSVPDPVEDGDCGEICSGERDRPEDSEK